MAFAAIRSCNIAIRRSLRSLQHADVPMALFGSQMLEELRSFHLAVENFTAHLLSNVFDSTLETDLTVYLVHDRNSQDSITVLKTIMWKLFRDVFDKQLFVNWICKAESTHETEGPKLLPSSRDKAIVVRLFLLINRVLHIDGLMVFHLFGTRLPVVT